MMLIHSKGRREIIRFSKTTCTPEDPNCAKSKHTIVVLSDRKIVERIAIWRRNGSRPSGLERTRGNWKLIGEIAKECDLIYTADQFFSNYEKLGYEKERLNYKC